VIGTEVVGAQPVKARSRRTGHRLDVLLALTTSDLRVRYGRGGLRVAKWILDPLAALGVYLLLVSFAVSKRGPAPGLSLACAVIPFQLVVATAVNAMSSVHIRRNVVLNMGFDRRLLPVASVLTETVVFLADLVLLALVMAVYGKAPTAALLWFPIVLATTLALALGLAYPATIFGVWFPDLRLLGVSVVRTLFFLASGLVPLARVPESAQTLLRINPLTEIFESWRALFLYGHSPGLFNLLYPLLIAAGMLAVFLPLYRREQQQFAKVVD